jgi:RES domain-containing protein
MIVFRLCKAEYRLDLSGKGAEKSGGRWNSKGTPMVYTGETRALCTTEIAVHTPLGILPKDYHLITLEIPEQIKMYELPVKRLSADWNSFPHGDATQQIGDGFIKEGKYVVMKVPSAVVQGEFNYLINPFHLDVRKLSIMKTELFRFDERLFKRT